MKKILGISFLSCCLLLLFNCDLGFDKKADTVNMSSSESFAETPQEYSSRVILPRDPSGFDDVLSRIAKIRRDRHVQLHKNQSDYTEPGEQYEDLYDDLPSNMGEIVEIIRASLIHAFSELWKYPDHPGMSEEFGHDYPTVELMLRDLVEKDPRGLTTDRAPNDRLVVTCRSYSMLLASILKSKGVSVRLRYGFADINPLDDFMYSHVVCEVWNPGTKKWVLVDASRDDIFLNNTKWEYAGDVWLAYRNDGLDVSEYGVDPFWGAYPVADGICHDMASVLGLGELMYTENPPLTASGRISWSTINDYITKMNTLGKLAKYLNKPFWYYSSIESLYEKYSFLQYNN